MGNAFIRAHQGTCNAVRHELIKPVIFLMKMRSKAHSGLFCIITATPPPNERGSEMESWYLCSCATRLRGWKNSWFLQRRNGKRGEEVRRPPSHPPQGPPSVPAFAPEM